MKVMIEKLKLHNETELWFEPDVSAQTVDIFLYDVYNETKTRLTTWQGNRGIPGGAWDTKHFGNVNKFFNIAKGCKNKFTKSFNRCKEYLNTNGETKDGFTAQWNCLKRRVNIKIHKLTK
jgi:hypothetical protein